MSIMPAILCGPWAAPQRSPLWISSQVRSSSEKNLTTRMPLLGFVQDSDIYKPKILNPTTSIDTSDRVLACRNDLRVKVGRRPKEARTIKHVLEGYGRNTTSFFPRPPNNLPLLVPRSAVDASPSQSTGFTALSHLILHS